MQGARNGAAATYLEIGEVAKTAQRSRWPPQQLFDSLLDAHVGNGMIMRIQG